MYVTVQVELVAVLAASVHVAPIGSWKTPLSPAPAFEKVTVPVGGAFVGCVSTSVTVAVQVTVPLIVCGIGPQVIEVVVSRRLTTVAAVAELLVETGSLDDELTVAVFDREPPDGWYITLATIFRVCEAPAATVPMFTVFDPGQGVPPTGLQPAPTQ